MNLYSKARKHIDMNRVKELRQKKIKEEKIAELILEQEKICAELKYIETKESKYCDWRKELEEGMTTSGMGMINLDAVGDVDLATNDVGASASYFQSSNAQFSGSQATFNFSGSAEVGQTYLRQGFFNQIDATKFDSFVTTVTVGSGPSSWNEPRVGTRTHTFPGGFRVVMYSKSQESNLSSYSSIELSTGTNTITIPSNKRVSDLVVYYTAWANKDPLQTGGATGNHIVHSASFQRRGPMNVLVPLDDPEANSLIRDGKQDKKSSKEKKKLLEKQLKAAREYLKKMFGEGMPNGTIEIADYVLQQSFAEIAQGPKGFDRKPGTYNNNLIIPIDSPGSKWRPGEGFEIKDPLKNIPFQGPGLSRKTKKPLVAHHKPEGKVIKEKKSFKDITKKIPGYYDDKPSPLGFPLEEPPKMVNGYHPDLVDGKKVANRFNRLDPQSAKAMPKTGNPHIDKKVRAAAKKPK